MSLCSYVPSAQLLLKQLQLGQTVSGKGTVIHKQLQVFLTSEKQSIACDYNPQGECSHKCPISHLQIVLPKNFLHLA